MSEPFVDYLAEQFMKDFRGTKDQYEDAFDGWLSNLDVDEVIEYGNLAMLRADRDGFAEAGEILIKATEVKP